MGFLYKFAKRSRWSADATLGQWSQNDDFMPFTTNTAIRTPVNAADPSSLPARSLDGNMRTFSFSSLFTTRPVVTGPAKRPDGVQTGGSVCGLPVGNTDPVVGPPAAKWRLVGTIAAPSADSVGPGLLEGHDRRCFAPQPDRSDVRRREPAGPIGLAEGRARQSQRSSGTTSPTDARDVNAKQPAAPVDPTARLQIAGLQDEGDRPQPRDSHARGPSDHEHEQRARRLGSTDAVDGSGRLAPDGCSTVEEPFSGGAIASLDGFIPWSGA